MSASLMADADSTEASSIEFHGQVLLILCGLTASGKNIYNSFSLTFADVTKTIGRRCDVERLARESLNQGFSVCIDRTNFSIAQRSHWIGIAREFPETTIWVIVFDTPYEICAARLQRRRDHPTIKSPEQGLTVLARFASDFEYPEPSEGYNRILYIKPSDHPSPVYSCSEVTDILKRVRDSPVVITGRVEEI